MNIAVLREAVFYEYSSNQTGGFVFWTLKFWDRLFCFMNIALLREAIFMDITLIRDAVLFSEH
jgi:hypothetical protein